MIIKILYSDGRKGFLDKVLFAEETKFIPEGSKDLVTALRVERLIGGRVSVMKPILLKSIKEWDMIGASN